MPDLVEDILGVERECDELLAQASQQAATVKQQAAEQIASKRQQAAVSFETEASVLRRKADDQLKGEAQQLAAEHQAALAALSGIPPEATARQVQRVSQRLLEA